MAWDTFRGLYKAVISDRDVFLVLCAALAGGSRRRRLKAFSTPLLVYIAFRRADGMAGAVVREMRFANNMHNAKAPDGRQAANHH